MGWREKIIYLSLGQILTTLLICGSKSTEAYAMGNNFVDVEKCDWSFWFRSQWKQPLDI
jgi:hypothetical protein